MGVEIFNHLHHFCYGMIYFQRASINFDVPSRRALAQAGINNFNYVLKRWPANSAWYQQAQQYKTQLEFLKDQKY